jgi:O-antigen ligase
VQPTHAVTTTAGLPPSEMTLVPRVSLALLGLMVSLPFLNFHHSLPLPTFYTEWVAFALGTAALLPLALARGKQTGLPFLSLGLFGLTIVLLIQVALGIVAYAERSLLGALYVLWAALLVWLGAHLREHCGIERVGLVLQGFVAFGGFLVAITGFILYYQIDWAGFRLISGAGMDGMYGSIAQRNNFANYLGCALASVVFLFGRRWLSLPLATLLAAPILLGLVLSISRSAWIYVLLVSISACWTFWLGDRERLRPLAVFSLFVVIVFVSLNLVVAYSSWFSPGGAQMQTLGERWGQTVSSDQVQLGVQIRVYLLKEAWAMFAARPVLGVGFGEFAWNLLEHGASFDGRNPAMAIHAHNALLGLLAETGLLGAFCVVVPLVLWVRAFPWSKPGLDVDWMVTLIAIQAAHSMVEFPLWHANFLGLTALLLGAAPQPLLALRFSRFRQGALGLVLAAGIAALVMVFSDYRNFERWYRQAEGSQRRNEPLSEAQLKDFAEQRATSLFAGYYDLLGSELLVLDREDLDAKLALNTYALRFVPIPDAVFRQAVFLSLKGEHENAGRMLSRLATIYPNTLRDHLRRLEQMARDDPAVFAAFAAEARRGYGR